MLVGDGSDGLWRVFQPQWWQFWRWWGWFRSAHRGEVSVGAGTFRVVQAERKLAPWLASKDAKVVPVDLPPEG